MKKIKLSLTVIFVSALAGCASPYSNQRAVGITDPVVLHNLKQEREVPLRAYFDCLRVETDKFSSQANALPQDIASAATYTCEPFAQRYANMMGSHARLSGVDPSIGNVIYADLQSQGRSFVVKRVLESRAK